MTSDNDLAKKLYVWATKEMHLCGHGDTAPTEKDFNVYCKGSSAAIWRWVVENVKSAETVKTVKGNLALKSKTSAPGYKVKYESGGRQFDETRGALLEERAALSREIVSVLQDISHLENEADRIKTDIAETDHAYEVEKENMLNIRRKAALLQAYSKKCENSTAQYTEYTRCIDGQATDIKTRAQMSLQTEEYYSRETVDGADVDDDSDDDCHGPRLETASARNVRESCADIGQFLHDTLQGVFADDKTEFLRRKEPLWGKVEQVYEKFSPDQILTGLVTNIQEATKTLKSMTRKVNIREDAKKLRFQYENGKMGDLAQHPSLLKSVHQLLQERNSENFQKFIQCQKNTNDARNLEEAVAMRKGKIEKRLQKLLSQKATELKIARSLVDMEIKFGGCSRALRCLTQESESLREVVQKSYRQRQELFAKYHRIQEFQELTDKKQNVIQVLVKQNINSQSRLDTQVAEIDTYVEQLFPSGPSDMAELTGKLEGCVAREVEQFASLSLPYLMFSQIDNALKTAVLDLSIQQTTPSLIRPVLQTVLQSLHFQSFHAPEMILPQCLQLKKDIEDMLLSIEIQHHKHSQGKDIDEGRQFISKVTDLCMKSEEVDRKQISEMQPLLQKAITKATSALTNCIHAKDTVSSWWEEPGHSCVPWVTLDGKTLQYYIDRWTGLATNLRQHLVK